jgi:hypothetical protein
VATDTQFIGAARQNTHTHTQTQRHNLKGKKGLTFFPLTFSLPKQTQPYFTFFFLLVTHSSKQKKNNNIVTVKTTTFVLLHFHQWEFVALNSLYAGGLLISNQTIKTSLIIMVRTQN